MNPRFNRLYDCIRLGTARRSSRVFAIAAAMVTMLALTGATAWAQLLFEENFNYANGTLLTATGNWSAHSGAGVNAQTATTGSLTYTGYASSGVGNAVSLTTSGEDDNHPFASPVTSGSVYAAALMNFTATQTTGDYFFHLNSTPIASALQGRVFAKKDPSSTSFAFGVQFGSSGVVYTPFSYSLGTTYLVVVKYTFVAGATNDRVDLFVNPVIGAAEPAPTLTHVTPSGTDPASINAVSMRQGTATSAPTVRIDGIRVGTAWNQVVSGVTYRSVASGDWGNVSTWESSTDYSTYATPAAAPDATVGPIDVRSPHTVTVAAATNADELTIDSGANVTVAGGQTLTINDGPDVDALVHGALAVSGTIANNGTIQMGGGTLRINDGGTPGTTGTYTYDATGNLAFATSGSYAVNSDAAWWPTTNGPQNVQVESGGVTMNVSRTVGTSFTTAGSVSIAGGSTLSTGGTIQINAGGSFNDAPSYQPASTLVYNSGGGYAIGNEWTSGTGEPGAPYNVKLTNNTSVTFDGNRNGTTLTAQGNLRVDPGSSLTLGSSTGGDLHLGGDWDDQGTFHPNGRTVQFSGTSAQNITNAETFAGLDINNSAGVSTAAGITVNSQLVFASGRLSTGSNTVTVAAGGSVSGAGAGKYVYGKLKKHVTLSGANGGQSLEVGDASTYAPVDLSTASGSSDFDVTASTTAGDHPSLAGTYLNASKSVNRYWTVSTVPTSSFGGADLTFHFDPADLDGGTNTSSLVGAKYDSPNWTYPSVGTRTATSTQLTGVSSFSDFVLGEAGTWTITASAGANGSISPSGAVSVVNGSDQAFAITPNACYHVADVLVDGSSVGAVTTYTFTNVTASHTIAASFAIDVETITASAGANGTISPIGPVSVNCGSNQAFTITPAACYHVADVLADGGSVGAVTAYSFTNVTGNHTIAASFAIDVETITASAGAGGTISPSGAVPVNCGSDQAFAITPSGGNSVLDVVVDGSSVGAVTAYTFTNVTANHTIHATFAAGVHTITATAGAGGTIAPSGAVGVATGSDQAFTITPNPGFAIQDVLVDGGSVGAVATYTFTNVQADHTIHASFVALTYTLNVTVVGSGTVAKAPDQATYNFGDVVQLTATPVADWHLDSWSGDASGNANPLSVTMDANKNITATFLQNIYTWNQTGSASWQVAANWTPTRSTPSIDDVLEFSNGATTTATNVPSQKIGQLFINGATNLTLTPNAPGDSVTVLGGSGNDFDIAAGAKLNLVGAGVNIKVDLGAGATGTVGGTFAVAGGTQRLRCLTAGGLVFQSGSLAQQGLAYTGNVFGNGAGTNGLLNSVVFQSGAIFSQASGSNPFGAGAPNSVLTFQALSRYRLDGQITPSMSGRTYADFEANTPNATFTTGGQALKIDNLFVTQGILSLGMTGVFNIKGNITVNAGAKLDFAPASSTPTVSLSGTTPQTITVLGVMTDTTYETIEVNNPSGIVLATDVTLPGIFKFTSGKVTTGTNTLSITGPSSSVTGAGPATGWVSGNLRRSLLAAGGEASRNFDVGDATSYTPVMVAAHGVGGDFNLRASTTTPDHLNLGTSGIDASKSVNRWYTLTPTGSPTFTSYDATLNFVAGDVDVGADPNNFQVKRWDGSAWHTTGTGTRTATSTQATGVTSFSDFAVGEPQIWTITASAGAGGTITPSGAVSVADGANQSFTIAPDASYQIADVLVDGSSVGAVTTYTFTNVTANHTIAASFSLTAQSTSTALAVNPSPSVCQQPVTLTATLTPSAATGGVEFFDGATSLGSSAVSSGVATLAPGALSVGAHTLSAVFTGTGPYLNSTSPNFPHTVNKATPGVTLASDVNPSIWAQTVTFTATVSPVTATGTITFRDSLTTLGTVPLSGGTAQVVKSNLYAGNHTSIIAIYSGDACYATKNSAAYSQLVYRAPSTTNLTSDINPSFFSQNVKLTAAVTVGATGRVSFFDGGGLIGTAAVNGSGIATLNVDNLLPGSHTLSATYPGDSHYSGSASGPYTQVVGKLQSVTVLSAPTPNPALCRQEVTLTANLPSDAEGTVTFLDNGGPFTPPVTASVVAGTATAVVQSTVAPRLTVGTHSITATYGGSSVYEPSTSGPQSLTVNTAPTSVVLTTDPDPSFWGQTLTLRATVTPSQATGTVTFRDSLTFLGTGTVSNGVATLLKSNLPTGYHGALTASYGGDACFRTSASPSTTHRVNISPSASLMTTDINPAQFAQTIRVTATMIPIGATGRVTFYSDNNPIGTAAVNALTGLASLNVNNLLPGLHHLKATYPGDRNYGPSATPDYDQTITRATTVVALSSNDNPSVLGEPVDLIATVTPDNATGTVEFFEGNTSLGSGSVGDGGVAVLTITNFTLGDHVLKATYGGNFVYLAGTSPTFTQTVNASVALRQPAETMVSRLTAEAIESGIRVSWATNRSAFAQLVLQRATTATGEFRAVTTAMREEGGLTVAEDATAEPGRTYFYRVVGTTLGGLQSVYGPVQGTAGAPKAFALSSAWPNPSRGALTLAIMVPRAANVRLSVLDLQGREVAVLADGGFAPGRHEIRWDGRTDHGQVPAGLYFIRCVTPDRKFVSRVTISR